jgi:hypothetical protein
LVLADVRDAWFLGSPGAGYGKELRPYLSFVLRLLRDLYGEKAIASPLLPRSSAGVAGCHSISPMSTDRSQPAMVSGDAARHASFLLQYGKMIHNIPDRTALEKVTAITGP